MDVTLTEKYRNDDYFQDKNAPTYVYMTGGTPGGDPFVSANYYTKTDLLTTGVLDARYYTETEIGTNFYTKTQLDGGQLDTRYYTETEIGANFYTKTQLDGGQLDTRYYTETEIDNSVVKLAGTQTITGAKTFSATATFASGSWDSSYLYASGYIKSAGRIIAGGLSSLHATAQIQGKIDTTIAWQNLLLFKDESNTVNFNIANGAGAGDFFPVFTGKVTSSLPGLYFCGNAVNGVPSGTAIVAFDGRVNDAAAAASDIILGIATGYGNYKVKVYGDGSTIFDNAADLGSSTYASGYAGNGWRVDYASPKYTLEIDNLSVRNTLTAYELAINKISSVGGSLVVSVANARSYSQASLGGSSYRIYFDEDSTNNQIPFLAGDVVRAQNYTGRGTAEFMGSVTSVVHSATLGSAYIDVTAITDSPWNVMDLVQVGHSSTAARQNLIYITASDTNNPYLDFLAGVTDGDFSGHQKARIGNLSGISDSDFGGALSGYGVYADNVYLKGAVRASSGLIGGFTIDATEGLYSGTGASRVQMKSGAGFWAGATARASAPFYVTEAGALYSTSGTIGGWSLSSTYLEAGSGGTWCKLDASTGQFTWSKMQSYCYSQQSTPETLTAPVYYVVALDNDADSTLNLPSSGLPGSGSSTSLAIIHAYGTGLGTAKYHISGNGYYINRAGTHATSIDVDEGHAVLLFWDPRQGGQWYAVGDGTGGSGSMVYPGSGIALSTGSGWGTSITNNSSNWNDAYTHATDNSQAHSDYLINNGNDSSSGSLTATNFILSSDVRLKMNIKPLDPSPLNISYKEFELKREPGIRRFGVIAQDLQKTNPELVRENEDGDLSVAYIDLLVREIANLKSRISKMESRLNNSFI